jgi:2-dehydro-3-deoxygalactonokinase
MKTAVLLNGNPNKIIMTKNILSCDWGTSTFRLRIVNVDDGNVLDEITSNSGINTVNNEWLAIRKDESKRLNFYRSFIQSNIDKMHADIVKDLPVIISGMVSSSIGMKELSYATTPFNLSGNDLVTERFAADEFCTHDILLVSGLQTTNDVMRGEETLILGCNINDEALAIFPGTHSKHVLIKNNVVDDFKTYMTGEFFELLSTKSLLARSVVKSSNTNVSSFIEGVEDGATNNILNASFHVRTNQLLKRYPAEVNYDYLSGSLIGSELSDLKNTSYRSVIIVANDLLMQLYSSALNAINTSISIYQQNANEALIKAHIHIYRHHLIAS